MAGAYLAPALPFLTPMEYWAEILYAENFLVGLADYKKANV